MDGKDGEEMIWRIGNLSICRGEFPEYYLLYLPTTPTYYLGTYDLCVS